MSEPRSLRFEIIGAVMAGVIVAAFCLLLLWRDPQFFWADDYQLSILPVFADVARSWSEGHLPLLSPYSWVCSNLAGEFQYGTFSIFVNAAVVFIWKFPLTFAQQAAALSIAHLFVLAAGAYLLARGRNVSPPIASMVAIVAALNGWMLCWGATDWFAAVAVFAWLPWCWWALERALDRQRAFAVALLPAPFIYLLITGGFPYTILMLALVTAWLALRTWIASRDARAILRLGIGWSLGVGLSAPAWLALFDYALGSRRAIEVFRPRQWLVPINALPGLILPSWTVPWRQFEELLRPHASLELACGLAPIVLLIAAAVVLRRKFFLAVGWELGLLAVVLLVCMLPGAGLFRFSFRWLALFHLVLALAAAEAFEFCLTTRIPRRRFGSENFGVWAVLLVALAWCAMIFSSATSAHSRLDLPVIFLLVALIWCGLEGLLTKHPRAIVWLPAIVSFTTLLVAYVVLPNHSAVARFNFGENLNGTAPLDRNRLYLSLYNSPQLSYRADETGPAYGSVVRPGSTSMFAGVHLVNGYSPVGPAGIARLFDCSTQGQIPRPQISGIVLPESGPDGLLADFGVDGIIVARDFWLDQALPVDWKLVDWSEEGDVYHRDAELPHVRAMRKAGFSNADVRIIENSRQKVIVDLAPTDRTRPVLLAFSRPYFRGYVARLGHTELAVDSYRGLFPIVEVPAGWHGQLVLDYRPRWLVYGGGLSILCVVILVLSTIAAARTQR